MCIRDRASWVREQIQAAKKETDKPFGVNLMLMNPEADEIAKVIVEEGVKVVTTGAGNPDVYKRQPISVPITFRHHS